MVFITDARSVVGETRSAGRGDNGWATGNSNGNVNGNSGGDMGSGAEDDTNVGIFTSDILQSVIHSEVRMFLNCFFPIYNNALWSAYIYVKWYPV